jgi:uncharacterized protein YfaS (alpha-2-macroglobulin family)
MKKVSFFIISTLLCSIAIAALIRLSDSGFQQLKSDFNKFASDQLERVNSILPQERIYLQFDKTFYSPGETIWFSAYVRNAVDMSATEKSGLIQIQLISPKGTIQEEYKLICRNGKTHGDFLLDESLPGGLYKVRAFSRWQGNEPDSLFFEKEIQVQNVIVPRLKMKLDFERKAFGKGDEVIAKLCLETYTNKPLTNFQFNYVATINGQKIISSQSQTGNDGVMYIKFNLPKKIESNDGLLNVTIDYEGQTESISRTSFCFCWF